MQILRFRLKNSRFLCFFFAFFLVFNSCFISCVSFSNCVHAGAADAAMDLNNPLNAGKAATFVLSLMGYLGLKYAGDEVASVKNKVADWVQKGKYVFEQTTTGAIRVTDNLLYHVKEGVSDLVAEGIANYTPNGSIEAGGVIDFDSSVSLEQAMNDPTVAIKYQAVKTNDLLTNGVIPMEGYINQSIASVGGKLDSLFGNIQARVEETNSVLEQTVMPYISQILGQFGVLEGKLDGDFGSLGGTLSGNFGSLEGKLDGDFGSLKGEVSGDIGSASGAIQGSISGSTGALQGSISTGASSVRDSVTSGVADVVGAIEGTGSKIIDAVKSIPNTISKNFIGTTALNLSPLIVAGKGFSTVFPFSLPWDFVNSVNQLNVKANAPDFKITFDKKYFLGGGVIDANFAQFEKWAVIIRWGVLVLFTILLIFVTRSIIGA